MHIQTLHEFLTVILFWFLSLPKRCSVFLVAGIFLSCSAFDLSGTSYYPANPWQLRIKTNKVFMLLDGDSVGK